MVTKTAKSLTRSYKPPKIKKTNTLTYLEELQTIKHTYPKHTYIYADESKIRDKAGLLP